MAFSTDTFRVYMPSFKSSLFRNGLSPLLSPSVLASLSIGKVTTQPNMIMFRSPVDSGVKPSV